MKSSDQKLKIETIKTLEGSEVSFCPERGGMITSLKFQGKEILYFDEETFYDLSTSVRGGIPVLFPNAGVVSDATDVSELSGLKRHGFARDMQWIPQKESRGFSEFLTSNSDTKKNFSYDFKLSLNCVFEEDGSFTIHQKIENLDARDLPISSGLHPYFRISNNDKDKIQFHFQGGDFIKDNIDQWANGETVCVDNPNTPLEVIIPGIGTLVLQLSKGYEKIWVWSIPGKDFVCIEPVMRDEGGIVQNPHIIKPGESLELFLNIRLDNNHIVLQ